MSTKNRAGGWASIAYTFKKSRQSGGVLAMWRAMREKNACKTCAVGMGGQKGGMVNESGHFPEFCKKSIQAMSADMQPAIPPDFWSTYPIRRLQQSSPKQLEAFGRLAHPIRYRHGGTGYEEVSWEEALESIASKLATTLPEKAFFYFSGRSSNEAGFLLQLFARLYGTNNINNCSYYCHQASGVGLKSVIGSGTATIVLEDLDHTDFVWLIGANPASNHPRLMRSLLNIRRRKGKVIVVNTIRESGLEAFSVPSDARSLIFGSRIATDMIQPHAGGDYAMLCGVAKRLIESGKTDDRFLADHTIGFEQFKLGIESISWDEIETQSGLDRPSIEALADQYAASQHAVFAWAMGITHHLHGTKTVQLIAALALLRGMVGKKGAGLMPIRGHSNVQGMGSVGVTPKLNQAIFDNLTTTYALNLPTSEGLDTMACMEKASSEQLNVGISLGGNLYGSNPDSVFASKALSKLDLLVTLSTSLNTGHAWGLAKETMVLPVLPRDEEPAATTQESMFNFVRMSDGGEPRIDGPRSEVSVIAEIASRVHQKGANTALDAIKWSNMNDTDGIRTMISEVVPGWKAMGSMNESKTEFQIEGRTFHRPQFNTTDGLATLHPASLPAMEPVLRGSFRLLTIRSEGQFNTVVYEDEDTYRGVVGRDVVLIHPDDLARMEFSQGERVNVHGPAGRMPHMQLVAFDRIKPGNVAMYFPEANILLDRNVDSLSRTPAFKGALVTLHD